MITLRKKIKLAREVINNINNCLISNVESDELYNEFFFQKDDNKGFRILYCARIKINKGFHQGYVSVDYLVNNVFKLKSIINLKNSSIEGAHSIFVDKSNDIKIDISIACKDEPLLIVFEGGECSGKSLISEKMVNKFEKTGRKVIYTREPGGVHSSEIIRDVLLNSKETLDPVTETYLFAAARNEHIKNKIIPAMKERNSVIIMDRYFYSSLAYQGVSKGVGFDKVFEINNEIIESAYPDIAFYLKISPEERKKRLNNRGKMNKFDMENDYFMCNVENGYQKCKILPEFVEIDANLKVDEVLDLCIKELYQRNLI